MLMCADNGKTILTILVIFLYKKEKEKNNLEFYRAYDFTAHKWKKPQNLLLKKRPWAYLFIYFYSCKHDGI
jgi:hypothetical protein